MDGYVCGTLLLPDDIPDAASDKEPCCDGRAFDGPRACRCWVEVFDRPQAAVLVTGMPMPRVPLRPCEPGPGDDGCAYRAASPERTGSSGHAGDADVLDHLAARGQPFFCHNGIRRVVALVHPSGARYEIAHNSDYRPPIAGDVPYRADGRPADICAGWLLRRAVLTRHRQEAGAGG
jgi:hypothetical protein